MSRTEGRFAHMSSNPGSGPIDPGNEVHAQANMHALLFDVAQAAGWEAVPRFERAPQNDEMGRYGFVVLYPEGLHHLGTRIRVEMPGWPLDEVRYTGVGQNLFDFPRLYLSGSSRWWKFAVNELADVTRYQETA